MANKIVDRLVTELTADRAKMKSELDKSFRETQEWGQRVGKVVKYVGATVAALGATGAVGLVELTRRSANSARELENMAYVANATSREMQVLTYAGQKYQISQEKIADILKDVNDRVGDFVTTGAGPMADFFEQVAPKVGVTAEMFENLSGPQALQLFISSLERANLNQKEMTFYMEAIASDATALIPLFRDNGTELDRYRQKMEDLNLVLSDAEVAELAGLTERFDEFGAVLSATGDRIALGAVPAMENLMELLQDDQAIQNLQTLGNAMVLVFTKVTDAINLTVGTVKYLAEEAAATVHGPAVGDMVRLQERLAEVQKQLAEGPVIGVGMGGGFGAIQQQQRGMRQALERERENLLRDIELTRQAEKDAQGSSARQFGNASDGAVAPAAEGTLFDPAAAVPELMQTYIADQSKLNDLAAEYIAKSERTAALMGEETEAAKLKFELESGRFAKLAPARKEELMDAAERIDLMNQERATREKLQEQLEEDMASASELRQMAMSEEEVIYANLRENLVELSDLVNRGVMSGEEGASISAVLAKDAEEAAAKVQGVTEEMSTFAQEAARNMQSAFADFLFDPFEDGIDGLLENFGTVLQRMAAEAAAAKIFDSIGGWAGNNSDVGGVVGGIASIVGGFFADGGRPPMGKVSVVGEREPELFVPDTAGTIVPFSDLKSGGGGVSMGNVQMVFPGVGNAREAEAAAGAAGRRLMSTINNAQRYR